MTVILRGTRCVDVHGQRYGESFARFDFGGRYRTGSSPAGRKIIELPSALVETLELIVGWRGRGATEYKVDAGGSSVGVTDVDL